MRENLKAARLSALLLAGFASSAWAEGPEAEVRAAIADLERGYQLCDAAMQRALLHPRWSGFAPGAATLSESPDHLDSLEEQCAQGWRFDLALTPVRIDAHDNWAVAMGTTSGDVRNPDGELVREASAKWSLVYVNQGGTWRLYHGHISAIPRGAEAE